MKIVVAGAYGNLGRCIVHVLLAAGHKVVAADVIENNLGFEGNYVSQKVDVTDPQSLSGVCEGADIVISTVGLTKTSATQDHYQIDYQGNLNLLNEAKQAGVKKFIYISVLKADKAPKVPMVHAKYLMEEALKESGLAYIIYRPTGYFYDIIKVFRPMIEKGVVTLLGNKPIGANVIDTTEFANYIVDHLDDHNVTVSIGGKETYTYEEIARMCFAAAGKEPVIKHVPPILFDVLAWINQFKKNGKAAIIRFSKWTLTEPMVGELHCGEESFAQYIKRSF